MSKIEISTEEDIISEYIFEHLKEIPLIDKYEAYQLLNDEWIKIAVDLEMIQTEGVEAIRKVNPNIVIKKKEGKEQEVQEGWIGHIIPFELVQKTILKSEYDALKKKETRLAKIPSEYEEIIDSMTEEEKAFDVLNDAGDTFIAKEVSKTLKELKNAEIEELKEFREKLVHVDKLLKEEKELKVRIKKETAELHILTKETIENLSDEQVYMLLEKKWIEPLVSNLHKLPDNVVDELVKKLQFLHKKYETTYSEIENQIRETEKILCSMIDELDANEFDKKGLSEFRALLRGGK